MRAVIVLAALLLAPSVTALLPPDCALREDIGLPPGCVAWKSQIGGEPARDVVMALSGDGARAFVGMQWRDASEAPGRFLGVAAVDLATGETLWRTVLIASISVGRVADVGVAPDGGVLALAGGRLWRLDPATGDAEVLRATAASRIDVHGGLIVLSDLSYISTYTFHQHAFEASSWTPVWSAQVDVTRHAQRQVILPDVQIRIEDGVALAALWDRVLARDADTGTLLWSAAYPVGQPIAIEVAPDGRLVVAVHGQDGLLRFHLVDAATGALTTIQDPRERLRSVASGMVVLPTGGSTLAVLATHGGGRFALDLDSAELAWEAHTPTVRITALLASPDARVVYLGWSVGSSSRTGDQPEGGVEAWDPATGRLLWTTADAAMPEILAFVDGGRGIVLAGADPVRYGSAPDYCCLSRSATVALVLT